MTIIQMRALVRDRFPHVRISVKTVSFEDLARGESKCLTITGEKSAAELQLINQWAKDCGVLPDTSLRFYQ